MVEEFRGSDRVGESIRASGGSPINAADLFEEQALVKNIPKEATRQLGGNDNQIQAMPKEAPLLQPENAQGEATRNDAPLPPNAEGQMTRNDQPPQTRHGLAREGDRTRPVSPIDLSPNPYSPGIAWQSGAPGTEREIMKGPKFRPDASDSRPANRPDSTPPGPISRPVPWSLEPTPRPRPGTPEWDRRPIPEVNRPDWGNWGR